MNEIAATYSIKLTNLLRQLSAIRQSTPIDASHCEPEFLIARLRKASESCISASKLINEFESAPALPVAKSARLMKKALKRLGSYYADLVRLNELRYLIPQTPETERELLGRMLMAPILLEEAEIALVKATSYPFQ